MPVFARKNNAQQVALKLLNLLQEQTVHKIANKAFKIKLKNIGKEKLRIVLSMSNRPSEKWWKFLLWSEVLGRNE